MSLTWIAIAILLFLFIIKIFSHKTNTKLPPGPIPFPIIGSLHLLGKHPHRQLQKLSQKYGPIMHLRLGLKPAIFVSSPEAAELFLKTHDNVFSTRPPLEASKYISYQQKGLVMAPYGSYWRKVRKFCTLKLLSNHKIESFKSMRKQELDHLIEYVKDCALSGNSVDLSAKIGALSADMTCRMVFGKKYGDDEFDKRGFKGVIDEVTELAIAFNIGDYVPQLTSFDLQGLRKRMEDVSKVFDVFFEKVIDEHLGCEDENRAKDFVDVLLSFLGSEEAGFDFGRGHVKALILDMLGAAMDTSASVIEWTFTELLRYPRVMKKLQRELESVVGKNRMVEESDLNNLEYLDLVIKETMRLHVVTPLLMHASAEECEVQGYYIPKNSRVFINLWAIGRDPNVWNDPEEFRPERMVGINIDSRGYDFRFIPFGSGRRSCPGMQLGLIVVRLIVAQLVHCFDWELPDHMQPCDLDVEEHLGVVMCRAKHLGAIPAYRLSI